MNVNIISLPCRLDDNSGYFIQIFFAGTPNGTFTLQASGDAPPTPAQMFSPSGPPIPIHWLDINDSAVEVTEAGNVGWNINGARYNYVQVIYTDNSSGSSTATITAATINAKG